MTMRYAVIEDGIVANVVIADEPLFKNWVPDPDRKAHIRGAWDGQEFHVPPIDLEDAAWSIRKIRDELLAKSDWTDTLSAQSRLGEALYGQWQEYRQALRDVPQQSGFPFEVAWPQDPAN